jgi:hypothetical protein
MPDHAFTQQFIHFAFRLLSQIFADQFHQCNKRTVWIGHFTETNGNSVQGFKNLCNIIYLFIKYFLIPFYQDVQILQSIVINQAEDGINEHSKCIRGDFLHHI